MRHTLLALAGVFIVAVFTAMELGRIEDVRSCCAPENITTTLEKSTGVGPTSDNLGVTTDAVSSYGLATVSMERRAMIGIGQESRVRIRGKLAGEISSDEL